MPTNNSNRKAGVLLGSEALLLDPLLLPAREVGAILESVHGPILLHHAIRLLLSLVLLESRNGHVFDVPCVLVLHQVLLTFLQHLEDQGWEIWLIAELCDRGEQSLEVEHDATRERHAAKSLPVHP